MNKVVYGFTVEPHKNDYWLVSAATKDGDVITCHDLSWFGGSWKMKERGIFIASISGSVLCEQAMSEANNLAYQKNQENK
jgi:hypothetical protein